MNDKPYDGQITSRRHRIEWPFQNPDLKSIYDSLPSGYSYGPLKAVSAETISLVESELAKCESKVEDWVDCDVRDRLRSRQLPWYAGLCNLYWRVRRQSAVWDCFEMLVQSNLLDPRALETPMYSARLDPTPAWLTRVLGCLTFPIRDADLTDHEKIPLQSTEYIADLRWLAVMLVRGASDYRACVQCIEESQFLGQFEQNSLQSVLDSKKGWPQIFKDLNNSSVSAEELLTNKELHTFGFILPHGVGELPETCGNAKKVREFLRCFNQIEKAFRSENNLTQNEPMLEVEQVSMHRRSEAAKRKSELKLEIE